MLLNLIIFTCAIFLLIWLKYKLEGRDLEFLDFVLFFIIAISLFLATIVSIVVVNTW